MMSQGTLESIDYNVSMTFILNNNNNNNNMIPSVIASACQCRVLVFV